MGPIWRDAAGGGGEARPSPARGAAAALADPGAAVRAAAEEAERQLEALAGRVRDLGRADEAGIFEAQAMMATDPELVDAAVERADAGEQPASAVRAAAAAAAATLAALPDELLAARAADVRDVGERIARILLGEDVALPEVPSVAIADDLPPSVAAEIPPGLLLGVALEGGSVTAHAVILARGFGIRAIVGAAGLAAAARSATVIALDGGSGEIARDPDARELADFAARAATLADSRRAAAELRD